MHPNNKIDELLAENKRMLVARENENNNVFSPIAIANRNGNASKFQVSIFVGNKRKITRNTFTVKNTVSDLKREIAENESGGNPTGCDVRLAYGGKPLRDDKTLGECGIINSTCFVTAIIRIRLDPIGELLLEHNAKRAARDTKNKQKIKITIIISKKHNNVIEHHLLITQLMHYWQKMNDIDREC